MHTFFESEWGRRALSAACVPSLTAAADEVKRNYENVILPQLRAALQGVCICVCVCLSVSPLYVRDDISLAVGCVRVRNILMSFMHRN